MSTTGLVDTAGKPRVDRVGNIAALQRDPALCLSESRLSCAHAFFGGFFARPGDVPATAMALRMALPRWRTQCVNALRGHLMEYGYVFPKGITHVETLVAVVEDLQSALPDSARVILKLLIDTFTALEAQITALDAEINQGSKSDPTGAG